jgi:hypothetical protein
MNDTIQITPGVDAGPAIVRVKVTKPAGLHFRLKYYNAGAVVEASIEDATELYKLGFVEILEPHKLGPELPEKYSPPADPEPFQEDPRIHVKVLKNVLFHRRSYSKGEEATLPERVAVRHVALESAKLLKGSDLSDRGRRFLRNLLSRPGEKDYQGSPTY